MSTPDHALYDLGGLTRRQLVIVELALLYFAHTAVVPEVKERAQSIAVKAGAILRGLEKAKE